MEQKKLLRLLQPLRRRKALERWVLLLSQGLLAGLICGLLVRILGKFYVLPKESLFLPAFLLLGAASAVVRFLVQKETWRQTACSADALGLKERIITAYELLEQPSRTPLEEAAVEDALQWAKKTDWKQYRLHWPKKWWACLLVLSMAFFLLGFVKNPNRDYPLEAVQAELLQAKEMAEENKEEALLSAQGQAQLEQELSALKKELKEAKTLKEGIRALEEGQTALKELEKQESKDLSAMKEAFGGQEALAQAAEAMAQKNATALSSAMEAMAEGLEGLSEEELEALAAAMEEAANQVEDQELKEALKEAAGQAAKGSISTGTLSALNQSMAKAVQKAQNAQTATSSVNQQLKNAAKKLQSQSTPGTTGGEGQGQGEGNGQGNSQGNGISQGQGQGGNTHGAGGQGRGYGSGELYGEATQEGAQMEGYDAQVEGTDTQNGTSQIISAQIIGQNGTQVPLEEVLGQYSEQQIQRLEESDVPYGLKEMVETYFSTLEP